MDFQNVPGFWQWLNVCRQQNHQAKNLRVLPVPQCWDRNEVSEVWRIELWRGSVGKCLPAAACFLLQGCLCIEFIAVLYQHSHLRSSRLSVVVLVLSLVIVTMYQLLETKICPVWWKFGRDHLLSKVPSPPPSCACVCSRVHVEVRRGHGVPWVRKQLPEPSLLKNNSSVLLPPFVSRVRLSSYSQAQEPVPACPSK